MKLEVNKKPLVDRYCKKQYLINWEESEYEDFYGNKEITEDDLRMHANFSMTVKEYKRYLVFKKLHQNCVGGIEVVFQSSCIGCCVSVRCRGCKEEVDITDYDCW